MKLSCKNRKKLTPPHYLAFFLQNQRLQAGLAITVLAYNNSSKQYAIKQLGGISFRSYEVFFDQEKCTQMQLCEACFQVSIFLSCSSMKIVR